MGQDKKMNCQNDYRRESVNDILALRARANKLIRMGMGKEAAARNRGRQKR